VLVSDVEWVVVVVDDEVLIWGVDLRWLLLVSGSSEKVSATCETQEEFGIS